MIKRTRCPICAKSGKDRTGDNLAIYPDKSEYCFSCGYYKASNGLYKLKETKKESKIIQLPFDICQIFPQNILDYLKNINISNKEIKQYHIYWSESEERICFPLIIEGELVGWQGRSLTKKPKWYSEGDLKNIIYLTNNNTNTIVLVEDLPSAINIGKQNISCSPIFGAIVSLKRIQTLKLLNKDKFILWLDKDKEIESLKTSHKLRSLGYDCYSLTTDKDPKYYDQKTLENFLTGYK